LDFQMEQQISENVRRWPWQCLDKSKGNKAGAVRRRPKLTETEKKVRQVKRKVLYFLLEWTEDKNVRAFFLGQTNRPTRSRTNKRNELQLLGCSRRFKCPYPPCKKVCSAKWTCSVASVMWCPRKTDAARYVVRHPRRWLSWGLQHCRIPSSYRGRHSSWTA
jgi:hypothetical protein